VDKELVGKMVKRRPRVKKVNEFERAALACFLILFLTCIGMISYYSIIAANDPDVNLEDSIFWQFTLTALISMMAGFLYGVNRAK